MTRVKLLKPRRIETKGTGRFYQPGEWVDIKNKRICDNWIRHGIATLSDNNLSVGGSKPDGSGAVQAASLVDLYGEDGAATLPYHLTAIVDGKVPHDGVIARGLRLVSSGWEIAVPFRDYKTLAQSVGTDDERERTKAVIRDLRVPLYDTRLMFVRRGTAGEAVLKAWVDEQGDERRLAFLRALYAVKPIILALPMDFRDG